VLFRSDLTDVTGFYSTHFPLVQPPYVREAPAYFTRHGRHYLITSGTTGYYPNPSEVAVAPSYHGPWTMLNDPHPDDPSRSSYQSQVSSVFRHPHKQDRYIALAARWLPRSSLRTSAGAPLTIPSTARAFPCVSSRTKRRAETSS
jgi:hypothetical protein